MSTVFDVTGVVVDGGPSSTFASGVDEILIANAFEVPNVTINSPEVVEVVTLEVPGIQGPPGLQNVYVQETDPAVQYGWGPEETNYIWIEPS